jgi:ornithine carbamoyltransferase
MKDLVSVASLTSEEIDQLIEGALVLKKPAKQTHLEGKTIALIFEKPSLRTRVSFDVAVSQLGGHAIYLSPAEVGLGQREPAQDVAQVLSRYVDGIVARTFAHDTVVQLAKHASVPVINGLSDYEHPCQALSDLLTIREKKGKLAGLTVAYVGDANNVANSLMLACAITGIEFRIASPKGYTPSDEVLAAARRLKGRVTVTEDVTQAVTAADVVYTDVWTSMGQEKEAAKRRKDFARYQVSRQTLSLARADALFMHPLPAHHGEEVAKGLLDAPQSVVFDQAENRLHMQKAILAKLVT